MILPNNQIFPVGLDISDLSLKAVQLKKNNDKIRTQAIGSISLPKGLINNGEIANSDEVANHYSKMISSPLFGKFFPTEVAACLPETKTFIKQIQIFGSENIESQIAGEVEKNIPLDIGLLDYDWQVASIKGNSSSILVGAAPKTIIEQYRMLLEKLKLFIIALEVEPVSICRAILPEENPKYKGEKNKTYAILDIGAKRTGLTIYSKDTIALSVSLPISGDVINQLIAEQLDISLDQAEKAKIICGLDEFKAQGVIKNVLSDMIAEIVEKIKEIVEYYNLHFSENGPINNIYLCGGGANIKNLGKILGEQLLIETRIADPLENLDEKKEDFMNIFKEIHNLEDVSKNKSAKKLAIGGSVEQVSALSYATAIGLALRDIFVNKF